MIVHALGLKDFRNYERANIRFAPGTNIISGKNAQGKTNILEGIILCTCARSHRTGKDQELIRRGSTGYEVSLAYENRHGSQQSIRMVYQEDQVPHRVISHNGMALEKLADLFGLFLAVIFAPEDVMLVKEGPASRRRFLDILISKLSPSYFRSLQQYQRALSQRNRVLKNERAKRQGKSVRPGLPAYDPVALWTEQLASHGSLIIKKRQEICERLERHAREAITKLTDDREILGLHYKGVSGVDPSASLETIKEQLFQRMEAYREEDALRGSTGRGPHRDDVELLLNDVLIRPFASQGQQRSVVLALKLAELALMKDICDEEPVLLLDDVMSELDVERRQRLLEALQGHQVFITCTDSEQVLLAEEGPLALQQSAHFDVEAGTIREKSS